MKITVLLSVLKIIDAVILIAVLISFIRLIKVNEDKTVESVSKRVYRMITAIAVIIIIEAVLVAIGIIIK